MAQDKNSPQKKRSFKEKLTTKFKFILMDESSFHEAFSFRLKLINLLIFCITASFLLVLGTIFLIKYTPLNEYVLGYDQTQLRRSVIDLLEKTDSLQRQIRINDTYIDGIRLALSDEISVDSVTNLELVDSVSRTALKNLDPTAEDSLFRVEVEEREKYNISSTLYGKGASILYPPIQDGIVSGRFDPKTSHYAIDISCPPNTPLFAVAGGNVIFKDWSPSYGNVLIISHGDRMISVYKHISSSQKDLGDAVSSGELIALSGNSGEMTTGPHLHFELWIAGEAVNPEDYIRFEF